MRTASLFSGCGGLDLGAARAGCEIVFASDIDASARAAYGSMLPDVTFVTESVLSMRRLPSVELLLGGYPCQAFSDGGLRRPEDDPRARLFAEFGRLLNASEPRFFMVENVPGLARLRGGRLLREQLAAFARAGHHGYNVAVRTVRAEGFGAPQRRRRVVAVGVRRDLGRHYWFPAETHGPPGSGLAPLRSGGQAIRDLPLWPLGEFYEHPDPAHNFPWYFMSRNRKARWEEPARTVLASWRHVSLHPASPAMELESRDPDNKDRQQWRFTGRHDHLDGGDPTRPVLDRPRRLSARECARLQGLPDRLALDADRRAAFRHIGNAVPPLLAEAILREIVSGSGLLAARSPDGFVVLQPAAGVMSASAVAA